MDFPHHVRTVTAFARQALAEAARTHWPYLWANKHVNWRQRQYLTSSCVRGSKRGRICLLSLACMNLRTIIQEDEFLNTLSFIRDSTESRCDMPLHRTQLLLPVLLMRSARTDSCSGKRTWSLTCQDYDLLDRARRNHWLPWKDRKVDLHKSLQPCLRVCFLVALLLFSFSAHSEVWNNVAAEVDRIKES